MLFDISLLKKYLLDIKKNVYFFVFLHYCFHEILIIKVCQDF